jgi:hypothetical protein
LLTDIDTISEFTTKDGEEEDGKDTITEDIGEEEDTDGEVLDDTTDLVSDVITEEDIGEEDSE